MEDMHKFQTPPAFPKLGVSGVRSATPIVETPGQVNTKIRGAASAIAHETPGLTHGGRLADRMDYLVANPPLGVKFQNHATHVAPGYVMGNALRAAARPGAVPSPTSDLATQQHENFHEVMNQVEQRHGLGARRGLAANLVHALLADPHHGEVMRWFQNEHVGAVYNRQAPLFHEEVLAKLHNYLNDPADRAAMQRYHFGDGAAAPGMVPQFYDTRLKAAHRHLQRLAAAADERWLRPARLVGGTGQWQSPDALGKAEPTPAAAEVALIQVHNGQGHLLLGKRRDTGAWTLPGGHLEPHETVEAGARRELYEETGLQPESLTLQRVVEPEAGRPRLHCFTALCLGEPHSGHDPDNEVATWQWVDLEGGMPAKFWDHLTGPPGDANVVRQAYEPEGLQKAEPLPPPYPLAGEHVSGLKVRHDVPNTGSIGSTFNPGEYKVLPGIREVPLSHFDAPAATDNPNYAADDHQRVHALAAAIKASGEIAPLIVVHDGHPKGPYVLEGGHRLHALHELGAASLPALVVHHHTNTGHGLGKAEPRYGLSPEAAAAQKVKAPKVDWEAQNNDDYAGVHPGTVSRAFVPIQDLNPVLTEGRNPGQAYDWGEFSRKGVYPPVQVGHVGGQPVLFDGNHRVHYWQQQGFTHAPALVMEDDETPAPATEAAPAPQAPGYRWPHPLAVKKAENPNHQAHSVYAFRDEAAATAYHAQARSAYEDEYKGLGVAARQGRRVVIRAWDHANMGKYGTMARRMGGKAEDRPDLHRLVAPERFQKAEDLTLDQDGNGGQVVSEVQALLRHPDPVERGLALKLASCSPADVVTAAFDPDATVWHQALRHELGGPAQAAVAATTTGPHGPVFAQHDALLANPALAYPLIEAIYNAVAGDPALDEATRQSRLAAVAAHPGFGPGVFGLAKHSPESASNLRRKSDVENGADAAAETVMPHLQHLDEAWRRHAPTAPPVALESEHYGLSPKHIYHLPVSGHTEARRFMAKPYAEGASPLSGWNEASSQALYHAAGIGHLHQQSFTAPHGSGADAVPATVIHLEDGRTADTVPPHEARALHPGYDADLKKIAIMDLATGNNDRHGGNLLVRPNGQPLAIDHGLTFARSVHGFPSDYLKSGPTYAAGIEDPGDYGEAYKWWGAVAPQVRRAFQARLPLIRQDWARHAVAKAFETRTSWLDAAAQTAGAGGAPDTKVRLASLQKRANEDHLVEGAAKMELGHALEGTGEALAGRHPAAVAPAAAAFERHVMQAPGVVQPAFAKKAGHGLGPHADMGVEAKAVYHTPGGHFMLKAYHSKLAPHTGWNEAGSQALYHAAGIGHLHQGSHVTTGESGEQGSVVHMAPDHLTWDQITAPEHTGTRGAALLASPEHMEGLRRIGLMDRLVGNNDRHGGNLMVGPQGQPLAIDNGLAFNEHHWRGADPEYAADPDNPMRPGHAEAVAGQPIPETWAWWDQAAPKVADAFRAHAATIQDEGYRGRLTHSFLSRLHNLRAHYAAPASTGFTTSDAGVFAGATRRAGLDGTQPLG